LNSTRSTGTDLANAILKRSEAGAIDVFVLANPDSTHLNLSNLHFAHLRLIYFAQALSTQAVQNWRSAGAGLVVAQSDFTGSSSMTSARFIKRWAEGVSASTAAQDAEEYATQTRDSVKKVLQMSAATNLKLEGLDVDRKGDTGSYISKSKNQASTQFDSANPPTLANAPATSSNSNGSNKDDLQNALVQASSALLPSLKVDSSRVANAQALLGLAQPIAWSQLQNLFAAGTGGASSVNTTAMATEIWIEGDLFKYMFEPLQTWMGGKFATATDLLQGLKLTRSTAGVEISVYFSKSFNIELKDPGSVSNFQLYSVHVPKTVRAELSNNGELVKISDVDQAEGGNDDRLFLNLKVPVVSNKIYLRNGSIDLSNGTVSAEAGILGNTLGIAGNAQIFASQIKPKFNLWQTIQDNLPLLNWTALTFQGL
jgi:hypothetical protein